MILKLKHLSCRLLLLVALALGSAIVSGPRFNLLYGDEYRRGTANQYVNISGEPTVALTVYAPAFDGKDT